MNGTQTSVAAIRKSLVVNCNRGRAFEVFTREIGTWWPTDSCHSIGGEEIVDVVFEERVGGRIFERYGDGGECDWGSVLLWEPPERFVMKWHPAETTPGRPSWRCASPPRVNGPASSSSTAAGRSMRRKRMRPSRATTAAGTWCSATTSGS
jgi:hypothetical protein